MNVGVYGGQSEEQHLRKCIYSMIPIIQIYFLLHKMEAGKNGVGSKRERDKGRSRLMKREIEHRR